MMVLIFVNNEHPVENQKHLINAVGRRRGRGGFGILILDSLVNIVRTGSFSIIHARSFSLLRIHLLQRQQVHLNILPVDGLLLVVLDLGQNSLRPCLDDRCDAQSEHLLPGALVGQDKVDGVAWKVKYFKIVRKIELQLCSTQLKLVKASTTNKPSN